MNFYKYKKKYYKDFNTVAKIAVNDMIMIHNLKEDDYECEFKRLKNKQIILIVNKDNVNRRYASTAEVLTTED